MQDAKGNVKVGITSGSAAHRVYAIHNSLPRSRRPLRLVHAIQICHSIAGRVERAAHRRLCYAALPILGREWFSAGPRECLRAINIEADYFGERQSGRATHLAKRGRGRVPLVFPSTVEADVERIWLNRRDYTTEDDAAAAIKALDKRYTPARARKTYGPRIKAKR